jgi:hypothetical protein
MTNYGLRVYLKSHRDLHFTSRDDDRSAVTFWCGHKEDIGKLVQAMMLCQEEHERGVTMFDLKTQRNARVQKRYNDLMRIGKHGHYETMFRVVREEVTRRQLGVIGGVLLGIAIGLGLALIAEIM